MLKRALSFAGCSLFLLQGCGIDAAEPVSFNETAPSEIHRTYNVIYNEEADETTYTVEFSKRGDGSKVYMQDTQNLKVDGLALTSVFGAKSGVYSAVNESGYRTDDIEFQWTTHSASILPDSFPAPEELTPIPEDLTVSMGEDLVVPLTGAQQTLGEEEFFGVLSNGADEIIMASKISNRRATFRWSKIKRVKGNSWYFHVRRERTIERSENSIAGQVGTARYLSVFRSRSIPVSR